jgi:hypothetical protein
MDGEQAMTVNVRSKISCQDLALAKDIRMANRLKLRIHRVGYPLECGIEARFWKIAWQITHKKRGPLSTRMDLFPFLEPIRPVVRFPNPGGSVFALWNPPVTFFLFPLSTYYIPRSGIRLPALRRLVQESPQQEEEQSPPGRCTLQPRGPSPCIWEVRSLPESGAP